MMIDLSLAPSPIQELARWLAGRGCPLLPQAFDSPNNQVLWATSPRGVVRVLADRGQWFVELAPPGVDEYFDSAVWSSCLTGAEVSLELTSLAEQVAWLEDFLHDGPTSEYSIECLREVRRTRAFRRMGLRP